MAESRISIDLESGIHNAESERWNPESKEFMSDLRWLDTLSLYKLVITAGSNQVLFRYSSCAVSQGPFSTTLNQVNLFVLSLLQF